MTSNDLSIMSGTPDNVAQHCPSLSCPNCGMSIVCNGSELTCVCCEFLCRKQDKVVLLPSYDPSAYYSDLPRSALQYVIQLARIKGAQQAILERSEEHTSDPVT